MMPGMSMMDEYIRSLCTGSTTWRDLMLRVLHRGLHYEHYLYEILLL